MTLLRELAAFVTNANAFDLPQLDRDILRRHAADAVVGRIVGARAQEGAALTNIFGTGQSPEAFAGLAGMVRLTEMDDIHIASATTPNSVAVPIALALASSTGCQPQTIESAIYVGTELLVRFGKAMDGARAISRGFWPTRSAATLAACATAARIQGLTEDETHEALSLAAIMTSGKSGRFNREPSGRWIVFSMAVANGLRCALAARNGFNGSSTPPDAAWIASSLGTEFDGDKLTRSLGQRSVYPELSLKPYGTARQCLSAAEAMRELVADGLDPMTIKKISIRVPTDHVSMISQKLDPKIRASSFVSVAAQVATAAVAPSELYDVERTNVLANAEIFRLAQLCEIVGDPGLDAIFPNVWAAQLDVLTLTGAFNCRVDEPVGSPKNRMNDIQLAEKAQAMLGRIGQAHRANDIIELSRSAFSDIRSAEALCSIFVAG